MTDRRNRRDRVIAVIGSRAVCVLMAMLLAGQASAHAPPADKPASAGIPLPWAFRAIWRGFVRSS